MHPELIPPNNIVTKGITFNDTFPASQPDKPLLVIEQAPIIRVFLNKAKLNSGSQDDIRFKFSPLKCLSVIVALGYCLPYSLNLVKSSGIHRAKPKYLKK